MATTRLTVSLLCGSDPVMCQRFYALVADVLLSIAAAESGRKAA